MVRVSLRKWDQNLDAELYQKIIQTCLRTLQPQQQLVHTWLKSKVFILCFFCFLKRTANGFTTPLIDLQIEESGWMKKKTDETNWQKTVLMVRNDQVIAKF